MNALKDQYRQAESRQPPQASEVENFILGALLLHKDAYRAVSDILQAEHFYSNSNQATYHAIQELAEKGQPTDIVAVAAQMQKTGTLETAGGPYHLAKLTNLVTTAVGIEGKCRMVLDKFILRELIRITGELQNEAYETGAEAFEVLEKAETEIFNVATRHLVSSYSDLPAALVATMKRIEELRFKDEAITGVPTGFAQIDRITNGWQDTDLIIIAARPSVGKSSFALNLARNAAMSKDKPCNVGFFSLEMSKEQLVQRILAAESGVFLNGLRSGKLSDDQLKQVYRGGVLSLERAKIFIDDTAGLSIFALRAKTRRMVLKDRCKIIFIDYLQLITAAVNKNSNREQEISSISRELKKLAKELKIPIVALAQLSRDIEKRGKGQKVPMLSDLRESGAIEQDADIVGFLYRPAADEIAEEAALADKGYFTIKKHRNGELGDFAFQVQNELQRWTELVFKDEPYTAPAPRQLPQAVPIHFPNDADDLPF